MAPGYADLADGKGAQGTGRYALVVEKDLSRGAVVEVALALNQNVSIFAVVAF